MGWVDAAYRSIKSQQLLPESAPGAHCRLAGHKLEAGPGEAGGREGGRVSLKKQYLDDVLRAFSLLS